MRQITEQAVSAFLAGETFRQGNTEVTRGEYWWHLKLHGNQIAARNMQTGEIIATLAGWPTPTTRERLNGLAQACGGVGVSQRGGVQVLDDGREVTGSDWWTMREAQGAKGAA